MSVRPTTTDRPLRRTTRSSSAKPSSTRSWAGSASETCPTGPAAESDLQEDAEHLFDAVHVREGHTPQPVHQPMIADGPDVFASRIGDHVETVHVRRLDLDASGQAVLSSCERQDGHGGGVFVPVIGRDHQRGPVPALFIAHRLTEIEHPHLTAPGITHPRGRRGRFEPSRPRPARGLPPAPLESVPRTGPARRRRAPSPPVHRC